LTTTQSELKPELTEPRSQVVDVHEGDIGGEKGVEEK
jgi:hypothetical protein